jgi:hypothetical protein
MWSNLNIKQKSDLMKIYLQNGVSSLDTMKEHYNKFVSGGDKPPFNEWYNTVPSDRNDTTNYNLRKAYENIPFKQIERWKNATVEQLNNDDYHLPSVIKNSDGSYDFLKSKNHPSVKYEIDWYNSPEGASFKKDYQLDTTGTYYKYIPRNKNIFAPGGELGNDKDKIQKAVQDKNAYAKYNVAKQSWDENGTLYEMQLPTLSITADSPQTERNKNILLNNGYTQEDLNNPNIRRNLDVLANNILLREERGKEYLGNVGKVGLGLAGILTGGSGIGLAGTLGREGIKQGAKTLGRKALRFGVDTGVGAATDYASNKAIQGLSNGEYEGFGDWMNRGVFNGSKDDVWKPMLWDMVNPLGIATGIGTDTFLNSYNFNKALKSINPVNKNTQESFYSDNVTNVDAFRKWFDIVESNKIKNEFEKNFDKYPLENTTPEYKYISQVFVPRFLGKDILESNDKEFEWAIQAFNKAIVPMAKVPKDDYLSLLPIGMSDRYKKIIGWYNKNSKNIVDLDLSPSDKIHEITHAYRDIIKPPMYPKKVRDNINAHLNSVESFFTDNNYGYNVYNDFFDKEEYYADISALRSNIFKNVDLPSLSLKDQNDFIESLSNEELLDMFNNESGYSKNFMNTFTQQKGDKDELARMIKESLKILPAVGAGAVISNTNTSK